MPAFNSVSWHQNCIGNIAMELGGFAMNAKMLASSSRVHTLLRHQLRLVTSGFLYTFSLFVLLLIIIFLLLLLILLFLNFKYFSFFFLTF
jgi:hypothetical protein